MNLHKRKTKLTIVMVLVFVMIAQILMPSMLNLSFAKEANQVEETGEQLDAPVPDGDIDPAVLDSEEDEKQEGLEDVQVDDGSDETAEIKAIEPEKEDDGKTQTESEKTTPVIAPEGKAGTFNREPKDLGNIFTFTHLKIGDEKVEDGAILDITDGTKVQLEFAWNTTGLGAQEGDWATIKLSDVFKDVTISNQDIMVTSDTGEVSVGKYSIVDGELKFVFNDKIEDIKNGYVGLNLEFDLEKFKENIKQEIKFNDSNEITLNIIAKPAGDISSITKEGHPDSNTDAKEINWRVDVLNANQDVINDAKVTDKLPEGLSFKDNGIKVYELTVDYDGNAIKGDEITVVPTINEQNFEINFDSINPYKGYRIEYVTTIEDFSKEAYTNDAHFIYPGKDLLASATVSGLNRSNPIEKDGKYLGSDLIEWSIDVNKSGGTIGNAIVEDTLPAGLEVVAGSIEVYKITKSGDNWNTVGNPDKSHIKFPVTLGELSANDAYRIKFKTSIDYSEVNDGEYIKDNTFTNKTILKDGQKVIGDAEKTVDISRSAILRKTGAANVNYENKTLTWTVHVNEANHPITNAIVEDILPKGLTIEKKDIAVTDKDGKAVSVPEDKITITPQTDGTTKITIDLGNIHTEYRKIVYTTGITDFNVDKFENKAALNGNGVGQGGNIPPTPINPPKNAFGKSSPGINYNEKTISWNLTINPIREPITELEITDTFPNKGLILLPETLEVKQGSMKLEEGVHYILEPNTEESTTGYHKGFILTFTGDSLPLNANTTISYKTSYDPQVEVDENYPEPNTDINRYYRNTALFEGKTKSGIEIKETRNAQRQVIVSSWNSGKKDGQLKSADRDGNLVNGWVSGNERKVAWQLYTNYQQQNLGTGVSIIDTLEYDGKIDLDSIEVKTYNVNKNGNTSITETILDAAKYTATLNDDGKSFTLTFSDDFEVNERYVILFTTSVPDISQNRYTNEAIVKVGDKEYPYTGTVNYGKHDRFLDKSSGVDGDSVYTGDTINWEIDVNESLSVLHDAKIVDMISNGHVYLNDSLKVFRLKGSEKIPLHEGADYILTQENTEDGETILALDFVNTVDYAIALEYTTVVLAKEGQINNKVAFSGTGIETITRESEKLSAKQFSYIGGTIDPSKGKLEITKVDSEEFDGDDNKVIDNNETAFTLWYDLNNERVQFGEEFTTTKGKLTIGNLPLRTYYLREANAPDGYESLDGEIEIKVDKAFKNNEDNTVKLIVENTKIKVDVTGTKLWVGGGPEEKPTIELQLYRDGKTYGKPVRLEDGTESYTWKDLDKTDINGKEYNYTVDELTVPKDYKKTVHTKENNTTIVNRYEVPRDSITGVKVWNGGPNPKPNIELQLYRDGEPYGESITLVDGKTSYTWKDLALKDNSGKAYKYTVDEINVPEHYNKEISEDGRTVVNTYESPKIDVTGTKKWVDGPEPKPAIELQLYRQIEGGDRQKVGDAVTLLDGETEYTWTNVDETDPDGNVYTYTIDEVNVPENHKKSVDGMTVTNTYFSPKIEVTGTKVWVNGPEERPDVELQLYRDGEVYGDPVTLENGTTEYTWKDLDQTDKKGIDYIYTVDEVNIPENYEKSVDGWTVTNTYVSPKTDITGTKKWVNGPEEKPSIDLQLYRDGEVYGGPVTLENGTTEYIWEDLDKTDKDGVVYEYTVKEVGVPENYEKSEEGLTVINTYVIPKIEVTGTKKWVNGPKEKPSIDLQLYRDGKVYGDPVTLENGTTEYIWEDLDKTDKDGVVYEYTVKEVGVPENYKKSEEDLKITNTYVIPKTDIRGTKKWVNGPEERPSIDLQLYRDGEVYGDPVTLENGTTEYTWKDLDKTNKDGIVYEYTVKEVGVPENYKKSEEGLKVTNTYVIPKTDITGTKKWVNGPEERPSIDLQLYRDGEIYGGPVTLENGTTEHTWEDLDKTDKDGVLYEYTVKEVGVPENYEKSEEGLKVTNAYVSPKADITGEKVWVDGESNRPESIQLQLYRESSAVEREAVGDPVTLEQGVYKYTWEKQDLTDIYGNPYTYTVEEVGVPENYEKSGEGLTVINTYVIPKTAVTGTKKWVNGPKEKPSIELQLYRNGEVYGGPVTLEDGTTEYTWEDLDKTDKKGVDYVYTIDEVNVPENYIKSVKGFTVTNTYDPSEEPETPKPDPGKPTDSTDPKDDKGGLPKTGHSINWIIPIIGLLMVGTGLVLRRKEEK